MFFGGHKVAKILYIAIYNPIFTMVKPYIHDHCNEGSKPLQMFGGAARQMQGVWGAQPRKVQRVRGAQLAGM